MSNEKPLIAYIVRTYAQSRGEIMMILEPSKFGLEYRGYEVIIGTELNDIPPERVKELDLLIAHIGTEEDGSLEEQAKLAEFKKAGVPFVTSLGVGGVDKRFAGFPPYGKLEDEYYFNPMWGDIVEAVEYFLKDIKSQKERA